jgi:hypothetical protein
LLKRIKSKRADNRENRGCSMKPFKIKYKDKDGSLKFEIIKATDIEDARQLGQSICRVKGVTFLSVSSYI